MKVKVSIIQQLQEEAINPRISVSDLLRKSKLVAVKLDLKDFLDWIEKELNGYRIEPGRELPAYRFVAGELKAWNPYHGWQPIVFEDPEDAKLASRRGIPSPIGELDNIVKSKEGGDILIGLSPEGEQMICNAIGIFTSIRFKTNKSSIVGIIEAVRNIVLDWSLRLEQEGILGEGLSFSKEEHEKAGGSSLVHIENIESFAGYIGNASNVGNIKISQVNMNSKAELRDFINQTKRYISQIDLGENDIKQVKRKLDELESEINLDKPKQSKIKDLLISIKDILKQAAGNLVAHGIIQGIDKFIG